MKKMKKMKKIPKSDIFLIIGMIIFMLLFFWWMFNSYRTKKNVIDDNLAPTVGVIISNTKEAKGSWGVKVVYKVEGICYARNFSSTEWCQNGSCIGDSINIEYSSENPNISRLIRDNGKTQYPSFKLGKQVYTIDCND